MTHLIGGYQKELQRCIINQLLLLNHFKRKKPKNAKNNLNIFFLKVAFELPHS